MAVLTELAAKAAELDGARVEVQTRVDDLSREQRKADAEVELVRSRRARDEERLNSGAISNPKDLENLQHELVALERRMRVLEDADLELMEALEEAEAELAEVQARLQEVRDQIAAAEVARNAAWAEIDAAVAEANTERTVLATSVPSDLLALYEKARAQYGSGAAALRARRCEGCRLELNGADLREIAARPVDDVVRCPECSRILIRTAESGL